MVQLAQTYKVDDLPSGDDYTPLPAGQYKAMIVSSEMKDASTGGRYLQLEIDVTEGNYSGRKLFERLNLENKNPQAVEIAFKTLSSICKAVALAEIGDSNQLHNKPFLMELDIEKGKPYTKDGVEKMGSDQNRIKKYLPISQTNQSAAPPTQQGETQEAASSSAPPWAR